MSDEAKKPKITPVMQKARDSLMRVWDPAREEEKADFMTDGHWIASKIILLALEQTTEPDIKGFYEMLSALDEQGRKDAYAFLTTLEVLSHAGCACVVKAGTDKGDKFLVADAEGTHVYLGEGDPPALPPKPPQGLPGALMEILKKKIAEAEGWEAEDVELHVVAEGTIDGSITGLPMGGELNRLQDAYEETEDPIAKLNRALDRLPKEKRPRLPAKKLPEC